MICYFETSAVIHGNSHTEINDTVSSWTLYTHHPQTNTHTVTNCKKEKMVCRWSYWIIVTPLKTFLLHLPSGVFGVNLWVLPIWKQYEKQLSQFSLKHTDLCRCSESGGQQCKMCLEGTWQLSMNLRNDTNLFYIYPQPNPFNFHLYNSQWVWNELYKWIRVCKH